MTTIPVPTEYNDAIVKIIDWHLVTYVPEEIFCTRLNRILECFFEKNLINSVAQIERKDLYFLNGCIADAINNAEECGVNKDFLWEIHDWIVDERKKK